MKKLLVLIILIILGYIGYTLYIWIKYSYSTEFYNYQSYIDLFAEKERVKVDTFPFFIQLSRESDVLSHYNYRTREYSVFIWEIKSFTNSNVKSVEFITKSSYQNEGNDDWGNKLFSDSYPTIFVRYQDFLKERLIVDLGNNALITERFDSLNYKGVIGRFNDIYLKDNDTFSKVHFDYGEDLHNLIVLVCNKRNKFYLIIIESKRIMRKSDIDILSL